MDRSGVELKGKTVDFNKVNLNEDLNVTRNVTITGSLNNFATRSISAGEQVFFGVSNTGSTFDEQMLSGSLAFKSSSMEFSQVIRPGATGSSTQHIKMSRYNVDQSAGVDAGNIVYGGPSLHFGETEANSGLQIASGNFKANTPTRFGFNVRQGSKYFNMDVPSEHKEPKAIMHVRKAGSMWGGSVPIMMLETSQSNTSNFMDTFVAFRSTQSPFNGTSFTPHRYDWQLGVDGTDGRFKFSTTTSGSYDPTDVDWTSSTMSESIHMTLTSDANAGSGVGRVGIGIEAPDYPLHVAGYDGSNISIFAERDVAAYSDKREKTEIKTISGSINTIRQIRGVTYYNKDDEGQSKGTRMMGVIAQELEPHLPEIVSTDGDGKKSVKYGNLTGLLIQAVKEQQEQIDDLKREIEELKDARRR